MIKQHGPNVQSADTAEEAFKIAGEKLRTLIEEAIANNQSTMVITQRGDGQTCIGQILDSESLMHIAPAMLVGLGRVIATALNVDTSDYSENDLMFTTLVYCYQQMLRADKTIDVINSVQVLAEAASEVANERGGIAVPNPVPGKPASFH